VKLVLHLSHFNWAARREHFAEVLADVAAFADEGGLDGIAVADHLWQRPIMGGPEANCLEAYTTLAFLAARTRSVRLLAVATGAHFRHPAVLAKVVTTLDVLSGERAGLGIGAGHYQEECDGLGVPFPPLATRYELLEDALEVCTRMWSGGQGDDGPFNGHHVTDTRLLNVPQALHPPILVAGSGERRTLPLVARYADACSLRPGPDIPPSSTSCAATATKPAPTSSGSNAPAPSRSTPTTAARGPQSSSASCAGSPISASTPSSAGSTATTHAPPSQRLARHIVPAAAEIDSDATTERNKP
jgi:alkanesulfonate monooxygenase SsuD/methylene tetrahydromethanopterin reductase-like flavin-dependent oxidoreductase (luciferase family)